jgi:hypothetical protein
MPSVVTRRPAQAAVRRVDLLLAILAVPLSVIATWLIEGVLGRAMTAVWSAGLFVAFGSHCWVQICGSRDRARGTRS